MTLIERFIRHPVASNLMMAMMLAMGFWGGQLINVQSLPDHDTLAINVSVAWPGNSAEDVEQNITKPLELELKSLDRVKKMSASATHGYTLITLQYEDQTNMSEALIKAQEKVGQVQQLPHDAKSPVVENVEMMDRIANVVITGDMTLDELRPLAHRYERELSSRGIGKVDINGLPEQKISINLTTQDIRQLRLSLPEMADLIRATSQDISAGHVNKANHASSLRGVNQKKTVKDFSELALALPNQDQLIQLNNLSRIQLMDKSDQPLIFYNHQPAVLLSALRGDNDHTLNTADTLNEWLEEKSLSEDPRVKIFPMQEQWIEIKERIGILIWNGLSGLIFIALALFTFLNGKVAFWTMVGIPTSLLSSIAILHVFDFSINMVSIFAFIMTLGIIVDDTIIISEEIMMKLKTLSPLEACISASHKMFPLIMTSSLTTICAFLPLLLVGEVIGQILSTIPVVVICVVIASVIECFLILPGHLYHSLTDHRLKKESRFRAWIEHHSRIIRLVYFRKLLIRSLQHRTAVLSLAIIMMTAAIALIGGQHIRFVFFPSPQGRVILVDIDFMQGVNQQIVDDFLEHVHDTLYETEQALSSQPLINHVLTYRNQGKPKLSAADGQPVLDESKAALLVELLSPEKRTIKNQTFIHAWRQRIKIPASMVSFAISEPTAGPPGRDIDIRITGKNMDVISQASQELTQHLKGMQGLMNVKNSNAAVHPEKIYQLTDNALSSGITEAYIGRQLRAAFQGEIIQKFNRADDEIEVVMELPPSEQEKIDVLDNFPIITPDKSFAALQSLVQLTEKLMPDSYYHRETELTAHITADLDTQITSTQEVLQELERTILLSLKNKYSIQYKFSGRAEEQADTMVDMGYGLLLGILLIYLLLSWVFSSYLLPLSVMAIIPLSFPGVVFGHMLVGHNLTLLSLFGLFGLSGILVNDAIVLLNEYLENRKEHGHHRPVIIRATCRRLRPVLLTSITTVVGLIPLLTETSSQAQFLVPMATSISFGLTYSTALILIVLPILISYYEQWLTYYRNLIERRLPIRPLHPEKKTTALSRESV